MIDHFVGMGFSEEVVAKAIQENGMAAIFLLKSKIYFERFIWNPHLIIIQGSKIQTWYLKLSSNIRWVDVHFTVIKCS